MEAEVEEQSAEVEEQSAEVEEPSSEEEAGPPPGPAPQPAPPTPKEAPRRGALELVRPAIVRLRDALLMRSAIALAERIRPEDREAIDRAARLGRQRAEGAELLWSSGRIADGLRLAAEALEQTLAAAVMLARALGLEPPKPEMEAEAEEGEEAALVRLALLERGMKERSITALLALRARAQEPLPLLDEEVEARHGELQRDLLEAQGQLDRSLREAVMRPRVLKLVRARRFLGLGLFTLLFTAGLFFALQTPRRIEVVASSTYQGEAAFLPARAIDGNPATEWLAQGRSGWLELRLSPPRDITRIRLLNSHNRQYNDRATYHYRVELYRDGEQLRVISGEFPRIDPRPEWVIHEEGARGIDRIRLVARDSHRLGAGLAELAWDEAGP